MDRHIQQSRRQTFERLQSELETYVEILSDICARKRLRASRAQIEQATKNARSKRIEFEIRQLLPVHSKIRVVTEKDYLFDAWNGAARYVW